jgi:hypothetical protein
MGITILFSGVQLTGQIMGQMSGAQIAEAFDPTFDQSVPIYSQFLDLLTLAVFVIIGGHREVIDALLGSFRALPLGGGSFRGEITQAMVTLLTQSFILGIRAAAPAIVALLLAVLILGVVSRTLPQLNIMAVGFSLNATVMLAIVAASLGGIVWVFQDQVGPTVDLLRETLASQTPKEPRRGSKSIGYLGIWVLGCLRSCHLHRWLIPSHARTIRRQDARRHAVSPAESPRGRARSAQPGPGQRHHAARQRPGADVDGAAGC